LALVMSMAGVIMVRDFMTQDVKTVGIDATIEEAVQKMNKFAIGSVVVVDTERRKPLGIVTERDILRLVEQYPEPLVLKVKQVMSQPLISTDSDTSIEEAARLMVKNRIKRLPVVENDRLVGIVTSSDIMSTSPKLIGLIMGPPKAKET